MTHPNPTHRFAMVEGHRIAYLDEGAGPPLVLLHGIPTSSLLWREVIPELAKSRRVSGPSRPGQPTIMGAMHVSLRNDLHHHRECR
ncbi:alpha/beta fold hydrolase [Roseovarius sp. MBR-6]|jgi:hypothetical protein|uniref:alpha/beta fold hydrolase n=1 Tax=Roseovarius sp. MBR-6 TaxID=3156459 RepID=UPI003390ACA8